MQTKRLVTVGILNLILQFIGTFVWIALKLPYGFGGWGDSHNALDR